VADDCERALASTGRRGRVSWPGRPGPVRLGHRARTAVRWPALPIADAAGLTAAAAVGGGGCEVRGRVLCALYLVAVLVTLAAGQMHRLRICLRVADQAGRVLIAMAVPAIAVLARLPTARVLWLATWSGGLVLACRGLLYTALRAARRRGLLSEPTVVVGAGTFGAYVAGLVREHPESGLRLIGLLDDGPPRRDLPVAALGGTADLAGVVRRLGIQRVIVCFSSACRDEDLVTVMRASRPLRAQVYVVPRLYELGMAVPRGCLDEIWGVPLIPLRSSGHSPAALRTKRIFDLAVGAALLAVAAPLMAAMMIAVRLRTGQMAVFRQARVTGQGKVASIIKLRTLTAHDDADTRWTAAEHSPLGRRLRTTHLDELPQLINVMRGEMSLVGPRPERPYFSERFSREVPRYADRARMPSGMTGWAQVNGLNGDTSIFERARFDNYYAEYWSIWLDLVILARTFATVLRGIWVAGEPEDRRGARAGRREA
jgi:exopolysaccharide biosynthesis polyprenyl glycosylphosphotransferase